MWYYNGGWGGGGWIMAVFMIIFLALVIAGIVALVHYSGRPHHTGPSGPSHLPGDRGWGPGRAEDLLAERFARGEIDEEEYKRRLAALRERS